MAETRIEIIVSGENAEATMQQLVSQLPAEAAVIAGEESAWSLGGAIAEALAVSDQLPSKIANWWQTAQASDGAGPLLGLMLAAVVIVAAYGLERVIAALVAQRFPGKTGFAQAYSNRIGSAFRWVFGQVLRLVLFFVICRIGVMAVTDVGSAMALLATALLVAIMRFRIAVTLAEFLCASSDPMRRPTGLTDEEAKYIVRSVYILVGIVAVLTFGREFITSVVAAGNSGAILATVLRCTEGLLVLMFFIAVRNPVARLISLAFAPSAAPGSTAAIITKYWYVIYIPLVCLTVASDSRRILAPEIFGVSVASTYSLQIFILTPFIVAALRIWRDARVAIAVDERRGMIMGVFALLEGVTILLAAVLVLLAWQIDPVASADATGIRRIVPGLVSAALVIVIGTSIWRTVSAFLEVYAPEMPDEGDGDIPDGEGGRSGSRMETVFPIIRIASLVVIITVTAMLALAALGVQIAPLLAGAGVLGLAFGFGAQTLVKDVIAGMFYLYEDAFRVGEFIETGEGKGAIEKILLRSARLRHPRGAIYTIPFGSMGTIKNHSRDWVTVKFTIDVFPTEDLERLRKLVKKVGAQLVEDPEIGDQFIEPMKSQGAVAMVGPNYQIGLKFTCKPGDQFLIRRKAFTALQQAIKEHGIQLAMPRVVVDSQGDAAAAAASVAATPPAGAPA